MDNELITMRTMSFGFFGASNSKRAIASNSPEAPTDISGNEYVQNAVPWSVMVYRNPFVFQIEIKDKHGKMIKTARPKRASLQSAKMLLSSERQ